MTKSYTNCSINKECACCGRKQTKLCKGCNTYLCKECFDWNSNHEYKCEMVQEEYARLGEQIQKDIESGVLKI